MIFLSDDFLALLANFCVFVSALAMELWAREQTVSKCLISQRASKSGLLIFLPRHSMRAQSSEWNRPRCELCFDDNSNIELSPRLYCTAVKYGVGTRVCVIIIPYRHFNRAIYIMECRSVRNSESLGNGRHRTTGISSVL